MKTACHYAIVQFRPFAETGEFANVGVALLAPAARVFSFKLLINRHKRVTNFFEELDAQVFKAAMRTLREELQRIDALFKSLGTDRRLRSFDREAALALWTELLKPKETALRFGAPRVVLADDPAAKLLELFRYYVERNFVTREYEERVLERSVRGWLRDARLEERFKPARIGDDNYSAQFPFVELRDERAVKAIKPLNLSYPDASKIIDRGGQWVYRVHALRKIDLLPPRVLFAVEPPQRASAPQQRAVAEVTHDLREAGVIVAPYRDQQQVVEFART